MCLLSTTGLLLKHCGRRTPEQRELCEGNALKTVPLCTESSLPLSLRVLPPSNKRKEEQIGWNCTSATMPWVPPYLICARKRTQIRKTQSFFNLECLGKLPWSRWILSRIQPKKMLSLSNEGTPRLISHEMLHIGETFSRSFDRFCLGFC